MRKLGILAGAWAVAALIAGNAVALEIDVAPKTLVLKSKGGQFTVHTDVPLRLVDSVSLAVNGTVFEENALSIFADAVGNLVAQCPKDAVRELVGEPDAQATLTVEWDDDEDPLTEPVTESDTETFVVKN